MTAPLAHTPGPWVAVEAVDSYTGDQGHWHIQQAYDCEYVLAATVGDVAALHEVEEANARLIAASPCMARDLQSAWAVLSLILANGWVPEQHRAPVEQCRDNAANTLAKARGEA